jgi:hypothetical protein
MEIPVFTVNAGTYANKLLSYHFTESLKLPSCESLVSMDLTQVTHGAEPFLRSRQLLSHSRISPHFTAPEGSLPCSQQLSTGPYPKPDQSSTYHPILSLYDPFIMNPQLRLGLLSVLFPSGFPIKILYAFLFSPIRATFPANLILLDLIILIIRDEK